MILFYFVTGFLFGMMAMYAYTQRASGEDVASEGENDCTDIECELARTKKELEDDERDIAQASSLDEINATRAKRKDERKTRIMSLFDTQSEITNDDVTELLEVSASTAYNYLEELEKEGALQQSGNVGRFVTYTKR